MTNVLKKNVQTVQSCSFHSSTQKQKKKKSFFYKISNIVLKFKYNANE